MSPQQYNTQAAGCGNCHIPLCRSPQIEIQTLAATYYAPIGVSGADPMLRHMRRVETSVRVFSENEVVDYGDGSYVPFSSSGSITRVFTENKGEPIFRVNYVGCDGPSANPDFNTCETSGSVSATRRVLVVDKDDRTKYLGSRVSQTRTFSFTGPSLAGELKPQSEWRKPDVPEYYSGCVNPSLEVITNTTSNRDGGLETTTESIERVGGAVPFGYGPSEFTLTEEFENPFTPEVWRAAVDADFLRAGNEDEGNSSCWRTGVDTARVAGFWGDAFPGNSGADFVKVRIRWKINKCQGYKYFKIRWQEVLFPPSVIPDPDSPGNLIQNPEKNTPISVTPREWEWKGNSQDCRGNDLSEYDDEGLWSEWFVISVPPGEVGSMVPLNIEHQCYRGGFENLWQKYSPFNY